MGFKFLNQSSLKPDLPHLDIYICKKIHSHPLPRFRLVRCLLVLHIQHHFLPNMVWEILPHGTSTISPSC